MSQCIHNNSHYLLNMWNDHNVDKSIGYYNCMKNYNISSEYHEKVLDMYELIIYNSYLIHHVITEIERSIIPNLDLDNYYYQFFSLFENFNNNYINLNENLINESKVVTFIDKSYCIKLYNDNKWIRIHIIDDYTLIINRNIYQVNYNINVC